LEVAQIVLPEREVVEKIARRGKVLRENAVELGRERDLLRQGFLHQIGQGGAELLRIGTASHARRDKQELRPFGALCPARA